VSANLSGRAIVGLRQYVWQVCRALAVGPEASCWEPGVPATAYIALDGRLPGYPDHDFALVWSEENGWAAALETIRGDDMIVFCYLGWDVLAAPEAVAAFVAELRADGYPGQPDPPALRAAFAEDDLDDRLAGYQGEPVPRFGPAQAG
jgi:hypothetical protein